MDLLLQLYEAKAGIIIGGPLDGIIASRLRLSKRHMDYILSDPEARDFLELKYWRKSFLWMLQLYCYFWFNYHIEWKWSGWHYDFMASIKAHRLHLLRKIKYFITQ